MVVLVGLAAAAPVAAARTHPADPRAPALNPIRLENSRPGTPGWEIPPAAGTVITGYASETSVVPGQSFHLHVAAPVGSRYRVLVYRLGWYRGVGGRLVECVPGCRSSRAAISQSPPITADPWSGLLYAPWRLTDVVPIRSDDVSGYYEAKLVIVSGLGAGAVGGVPLIVRAATSAPPSAVLVQVPVNTWEAYNPWGGKSLYLYGTSGHADQVSFDRPYDQQKFYEMGTLLELPWVRFLERTGVDVSYQTDVDTDRDPSTLLHHRLVFAIGHDEYWSPRMRYGFQWAQELGTNLMFGSNSGLWRIRYDPGRRTINEWRDPYLDPLGDWHHDTGYFATFGQPGCQLMGTEYEDYTQRELAGPATPYTVVGPANDPWLSAAGLLPGDVIPGVVGYEWDSLMPGCFPGAVVPLMHAALPGSDGKPTSADMVRAVTPSGSITFAMGTMELGWALDSFGGHTVNPRVVAFIEAALADLTRAAAPAVVSFRRGGRRLLVRAQLSTPDPRIIRVGIVPLDGARGCPDALHELCRLPLPRHLTRYAAVAFDRWGESTPLIAAVPPAGPATVERILRPE